MTGLQLLTLKKPMVQSNPENCIKKFDKHRIPEMTSSNQTPPIVKKNYDYFLCRCVPGTKPKKWSKKQQVVVQDKYNNIRCMVQFFSLVFCTSKTCCSSNNVDERYENETYKIYSRTRPCMHTYPLRLLQIKMRITYNNKKCGIPCSSKLGKHIFLKSKRFSRNRLWVMMNVRCVVSSCVLQHDCFKS